jgi:uncharacterized phage-associated protein
MAAPISALSAAREICERSDWTITNLELQKMLYLAQMVYMGDHAGEPLFTGTFEAWDLGPVLPEVYRVVRAFGSGPIKDIFFGTSKIKDDDRRETLDAAFDQLSKRTAGQLVNITHWSEGAWAAHYRAGARGISIPNQDIYEEAKKRKARVAAG